MAVRSFFVVLYCCVQNMAVAAVFAKLLQVVHYTLHKNGFIRMRILIPDLQDHFLRLCSASMEQRFDRNLPLRMPVFHAPVILRLYPAGIPVGIKLFFRFRKRQILIADIQILPRSGLVDMPVLIFAPALPPVMFCRPVSPNLHRCFINCHHTPPMFSMIMANKDTKKS